MYLTNLAYRLKGDATIHHVTFDSFEEAQDYLIEGGLQVVVGKPAVENAHMLYEVAAQKSKADWFEFSHEEI